MDAKVEKLKKEGIAFADAGNYERAIECYDKALVIDPKDTRALTNKGYALYQLKRNTEAIDYCDKVQSIDPEDKFSLNIKGCALIELEQYTNAIECYDKVLSIDPKHKAAWNNKGNALRQLERFAEAIECYNKVLAIDLKDTNALYNKGHALYQLKQHPKAIECYDKVLSIDPMRKDAWNNKGNVFYQLQRYADAIECYDKVLVIDPKHKAAWNNKGNVLNELGQYADAIECYDKVLAIDPKNTDALCNKGNTLYQLKQYPKAIECYNKTLIIDPKDSAALNNKGAVLNELKQYPEAIECLNKALAIDPESKWALTNKGTALNRLDKYVEALEYFDKAEVIDPEFKEALNNKGIALDKMRDYQSAAASFYKAGLTPLQLLADYPSVSSPTLEQFVLLDSYFNQLVPEHTEHREIYGKIYLKSLGTVALLHVDGENQEGEVAHYTCKAAVRCMLFDGSPLRLCSVSGANDPSEGKVLHQYLGLREDAPNRHTHQAFVCCFSFDHDCLNQFRLYGKEAGREATGLSLVLRSQYFNRKPFLNIPLSPSVGMKMDDGTTADVVQTNKVKQASDRHALFRCIYIDPQTNQVMSLGRREEYAFYREHNINRASTSEEVRSVDEIVDGYNKRYTEILANVKESIAKLGVIIGEAKEKLDEATIQGLLIHLRYLVKDVAFMEERECRMVSIEKLHGGNKKVQHDEGIDKLYIKADPIGNHLERIYFAPKSDDIGQFRDKLAHKGFNVECRQSKHPYN